MVCSLDAFSPLQNPHLTLSSEKGVLNSFGQESAVRALDKRPFLNPAPYLRMGKENRVADDLFNEYMNDWLNADGAKDR